MKNLDTKEISEMEKKVSAGLKEFLETEKKELDQ